MTIQVKQNQTIWDIALQYAGSIEAAFDILEANGKADTTLFVGESLLVPKVVNKKVAQFFESETSIATSLEELGVDSFVPPASACLPAYYQIILGGVVVGSGTIPSGNLVQIPIDDVNTWVRHPQWPAIPSADDKLYIVWAVFNDEPINGCEIVLNSSFVVDWGDGNIDSGASDTKFHQYDYAAINAIELTSFDNRTYKPVLITADRNGGIPTFLRINKVGIHTPSNCLEVVDWLFGQNTLSPLNYDCSNSAYLESFVPTNRPSDLSIGGLKFNIRLRNFPILESFFSIATSSQGNRYFEYSFDGVTLPNINTPNISYMFTFCKIKKIGNVSTHTASFAFLNAKLEEVGNLNGTGTTSFLFRFSTLRKIGLISNMSNLTGLFEGTLIEEVVLESVSNITSTVNTFNLVTTLRKLVLPGLRVGINISGNKMQVAALNEFANSIGAAIDTLQVINIARNPGSALCDHSLFTNKGYQLIWQ